MSQESINTIWKPIVKELAALQDRKYDGYERPVFNPYSDEQVGMRSRSPEELVGGVHNPVCNYPLAFDTACAAHVFATEYRRTGEEQWQERANIAIEMVHREEPYTGVSEPRWDPVGWHFAEGSLSVTGTVLDALWDAIEILEESVDAGKDKWTDLGRYLEQCRHGRGKFAHNTVPTSKRVADVQNTTAFAYFLRSYAGVQTEEVEVILQDTSGDAFTHLCDGQRVDGFWPYIYPGRLQQSLYRSSLTRGMLGSAPLRKTLYRGSSSILFGDSVHHCYVLYYLLKGIIVAGEDISNSTIRSAWEWIENRLTQTNTGTLRFDFGWEPTPKRVQFCNFYDVTTYFLILATLPLLQRVGLIEEDRVQEVASGIISHLDDRLVNTAEMPCLPAHECDYGDRRRILPAVWGGTSLKGSLLANYLQYEGSI